MNNHMTSNEAILVMFFSMLISGLFTGMNVFANKIGDVRLNINDFYMGSIMSGVMYLIMGIYYLNNKLLLLGLLITTIAFILIRNQIFVNKNAYLNSMIPHHSMAIMITNRLIEKNEKVPAEMAKLLKNIIVTQQQEIDLMKKLLNE